VTFCGLLYAGYHIFFDVDLGKERVDG
jgi:hypothetical protein